ncbi:MAG: 2-amino-4-hydroxy-6-hydroxymethyldihydropteridine diphosphokinase, partial [Thiohalomonadales bacterium]
LDIYIGLGSNLGESRSHIRDAIEEIKSINNCDLIKKSSLYKTPPMGPPDQPDYINAVIKIQSSVRAIELLDELHEIEQIHGRVREVKWGPRSLDLDILIYGSLKFDTYKLKIPHPGLYDRAFVLYPILEIEPELTLPNGVSLVEHIELMGKQDIVKLT